MKNLISLAVSSFIFFGCSTKPIPTVLPELSGQGICDDENGAGTGSSPCFYASESANVVYGRIAAIEELSEPLFSSSTGEPVSADRCLSDDVFAARVFTLVDVEGLITPVDGKIRVMSRREDGFGGMEVGMAFGTGIVSAKDGLFVQSSTLFTFLEDGTAVFQEGYCGLGRVNVSNREELVREFAQCPPNDAGTTEYVGGLCPTERPAEASGCLTDNDCTTSTLCDVASGKFR
jgi:hypothetical protein